MRHWIRLELILMLGCLTVNGLAFLATAGYPQRVEIARQAPAPEGEKYLDTCDGRPTSELGSLDMGCLADYPGEFARGIIFALSIVLLFLVNLLYMTLQMYSAKRRRDRHRPHQGSTY